MYFSVKEYLNKVLNDWYIFIKKKKIKLDYQLARDIFGVTADSG